MNIWWYDRESEGFIPYSKKDHLAEINRVDMWSAEEVIIVGPSKTIAGVFLSHDRLGALAVAKGLVPDIPPDGVCSVSMGKENGWHSSGYNFMTPEGPLREAIISELGLTRRD